MGGVLVSVKLLMGESLSFLREGECCGGEVTAGWYGGLEWCVGENLWSVRR